MMARIFALPRKAIWLIHKAIDQRIVSEEARYRVEPPEEDEAGDFGNDLTYLKALREDFSDTREGIQTAQIYECWLDPADNGTHLSTLQNAREHRKRGQLSEAATLSYAIVAESWEEAMAIHHVRQGWAPYVPMGDAVPCPNCASPYYPLGSGGCWRCGPVGA
jgi:hypothetical protein